MDLRVKVIEFNTATQKKVTSLYVHHFNTDPTVFLHENEI